MTKEYSLPVPLILQNDCYADTNEMCGAACAQMVLRDLDPNRPSTFQGQTEQVYLFSQIRRQPTPPIIWHNPPQGITRVLNQEKPGARRQGRARANLPTDIKDIFASVPPDSATTYEFVILGNSSPDNDPNPGIPRSINVRNQLEQIELLSRLLIRTIAIKGAAPIVAVREDNAHWIVVNGFQVDKDYNDADLGQRGKIKAIIIRNPLGRYNYRTVNCKSVRSGDLLEITGHECKQNAYVHDVVPFATWVREYLFSDWAETFVAICDWSAQVTGNILPPINCYASTGSEKPEITKNPSPNGDITDEDAIKRAESAIEDLNLSQFNQRVKPESILTPVRVKRLDRIDGDYFLVPVGIRDGDSVRVSALINISIKGEIDGAIILPITKRRAPHWAKKLFLRWVWELLEHLCQCFGSTAKEKEHYIPLFDQHPNFNDLISKDKSFLIGKRIRLATGEVRTIKEVRQDTTFPYVWRPSPESFSPSRPFNNLILTVDEEGQSKRIPFYLPVDNYCLPGFDTGVISLPSANYLETVAKCIKQKAGNMIGEVLVLVNRRGNTALVLYKSNRTTPPINDELDAMRRIICECLNEHRTAGLTHFRIKAFATNAFLTRHRGGGGDDGGLGSSPPPGGGDAGHSIDDDCS